MRLRFLVTHGGAIKEEQKKKNWRETEKILGVWDNQWLQLCY